MKIQPAGSEGMFQIGFGAIRTLTPYASEDTPLLEHTVQLAHAPALVVFGETRGYLRLHYDSERGYGDTRLYVTDSDFTSFALLLRQHQGLRNTDAPPCLKRPGEDPAWPTFPEKIPLELKQGIEDVMACLRSALLPLFEYPQMGDALQLTGKTGRRTRP